MPAPTVIVITNGTLRIADDEATLPTALAYSCQVIQAAIEAEPNLQDVPATFCAPASSVPAATGYSLAITWLQDWTDVGGGLSGYAYENDTLEKHFSLSLEGDGSAPPVCTGILRIVAGAFGGEAGTPLQAEAAWPIQGKPVITYPAAPPPPAPDTAKATAKAAS